MVRLTEWFFYIRTKI